MAFVQMTFGYASVIYAFSIVAMRLEYQAVQTFLNLCGLIPTDQKRRRQLCTRIVSLTHAMFTATGPIVCAFVYAGDFWRDPIYATNVFSQHLCLFSAGYFTYDLLDIIAHGEGRTYVEYLVHHSLAASCHWSVWGTGQLMLVAMMGFLPELNTIFMHARLILKLTHVPRTSPLYRLVQTANMVTMVFFRHIASFMILYVLSYHFKDSHVWLRSLLFLACTFLVYHNTHVLYRLMVAEGYIARMTLGAPEQTTPKHRKPKMETATPSGSQQSAVVRRETAKGD